MLEKTKPKMRVVKTRKVEVHEFRAVEKGAGEIVEIEALE
jgi:hypothetical protein